jgi:hypothetical protein
MQIRVDTSGEGCRVRGFVPGSLVFRDQARRERRFRGRGTSIANGLSSAGASLF